MSIWPSRFARGRIRLSWPARLPTPGGRRCDGATSPAASSHCTPPLNANVVEHLVARVVARDECNPRAPMASRATEVKPVERDRHVEEPLGPRTVGPHQIRMQQTVAEVAGWG